MPTKIKIFDVRKVPSAEVARIGKTDVLVMYELDPMRRYIIKIPEEEFSEDKIVPAIKADMEERSKYTGKEFEIPD